MTESEGKDTLHGARGQADLTTDGQVVAPSGSETQEELEAARARSQHLHRKKSHRDGIYTHAPGARASDTVWLVRSATTSSRDGEPDVYSVGKLKRSFKSQWGKHCKEYVAATSSQMKALFPASTPPTQISPHLGATLEERHLWLAENNERVAQIVFRQVVTCCPECSREGTRVGSTFRAPPKKDSQAWAKARALTIEEGERWDFCMSNRQVEEYHQLNQLLRARYAKQEAGQRVGAKHREREASLRANLGLINCSVRIDDDREALCQELRGRCGGSWEWKFVKRVSPGGENMLS